MINSRHLTRTRVSQSSRLKTATATQNTRVTHNGRPSSQSITLASSHAPGLTSWEQRGTVGPVEALAVTDHATALAATAAALDELDT